MNKMETTEQRSVTHVPVVRNFRRVIDERDMSLMGKELYEFLHLHCGFIAHYNMDGFKAAYAGPRDFSDAFIRHFDPDHRYFDGVHRCDEEPYKDTEFTRAHIKEAFIRIVEKNKNLISNWAEQCLRNERHNAFQILKREFEDPGIGIDCEACGNRYSVKVEKDGEAYSDFGTICCLFCGRQIKLY
jgi:hypothetical protein